MTNNHGLASRLGSSSYGPAALLWVDTEGTGLDPLIDEIIEITAILTNNQLEEIDRVHTIVRPSDGAFARLLSDPFLVEMHTQNGLLAELQRTDVTYPLVGEAQAWIMTMLNRHGILPGTKDLSVCGSGVSNHDIPLMRTQMPYLMQRATYFSACDVGVLRRSYGMWNGHTLVDANESKTHRSTDDIECHLVEGRAFKTLMTADVRGLAAASLWRTAMEADPEALTGINSILTACHAIATATGNNDELTPELDLNRDGIPMLHGSMLLNLYLLEREAERTGATLADALRTVQDHFIDKQVA